jgi:hypothetical protein
MSGDTKDDILIALGVLIILIPIGREIVNSIIQKKRFPIGYIVILLIVSFGLYYFGRDKNSRDNASQKGLTDSVSLLHVDWQKSDSARSAENNSTRIFLDSLKDKYNIIRNSKNEPIFINNGKSVNVVTNKGKMDIKM